MTVAVHKTVVGMVLVALCSCQCRAAEWCYGQSWCQGLDRRVDRDDRSTWPSDVVRVEYQLGDDNHFADELNSTYFAPKGISTDSEAFQTLAQDHPYPITTRLLPPGPFHSGHNQTLMLHSGRPLPQDGPPPAFLDQSYVTDAIIGGSLQLPCRVENQGHHFRVWMHSGEGAKEYVIGAFQVPLTPDEHFKFDGGGLEITNLRPEDEGRYTCQLGRIEGFKLVYSVNIIAPSRFLDSPVTRDVTVGWKKRHALRCDAAGRPSPLVKWAVFSDVGGGSWATSVQQSQELVIEEASREHAATYLCVVYNGVGARLMRSFRVTVEYPPEGECTHEVSRKYGGRRTKVTITCSVRAVPPPEGVSWLKGTAELWSNHGNGTAKKKGRFQAHSRKPFHRVALTITDFSPEDLGDYSLQAWNSVGTTTITHQVSGRGNPVQFTSDDMSPSETTYNLTFMYDSPLPALEMRLLFRRHNSVKLMFMYDSQGVVTAPDYGPGHDHTNILDADLTASSLPFGWNEVTGRDLPFDMQVTLDGLVPGSCYEAIVQVRNYVGWNEVAGPFKFYTKGVIRDADAAPSTSSRSERVFPSALLLLSVLYTVLWTCSS